MRVVQFSAQLRVPDGVSEKDILAWLEFELGAKCMLPAGGMAHTDLECDHVWIDRVIG